MQLHVELTGRVTGLILPVPEKSLSFNINVLVDSNRRVVPEPCLADKRAVCPDPVMLGNKLQILCQKPAFRFFEAKMECVGGRLGQ